MIISPGKIQYINADIPECHDNEVLIHVLYAGICASDIQVYHGLHKYVTYPLVQGHEGVGVVKKVENHVKHIVPGDIICVQPQIVCNNCFMCSLGHVNICENLKHFGISREGLFQEYVVIPAWNAVKLPGGIPLKKGVLVEPAAIAMNAIRKGRVKKDDRILVIGAGIIGNLVAQIAQYLGAEVILTDIQPKKLELAKKHGIKGVINTLHTNVADEIKHCYGIQGATVVFDCAAIPSAFKQALECMSMASRIVIVANYKVPIEFDMPSIQRKEIELLGVMGCSRQDFLDSLDVISKGAIDISGFISREFPLDKLQQAYKYIDSSPDTMKVLLKTNEAAKNY